MKLKWYEYMWGLDDNHLGVSLGDTLYAVHKNGPYIRQGENFYRFELALTQATITQIMPASQEPFTYRCDEVLARIQGNFERVNLELPFYFKDHNYGASARELYPKKEDAIIAFKNEANNIARFFDAIDAAQPEEQALLVKEKLRKLLATPL